MYARAYLDDMRALRNDSVDVYARASDYIDQVISQIERLQQAGARPSGRAARRATGRDHSSLGRVDEDQFAAADPARSRMRCRSGRSCSGADCGCSRCVRRTLASCGLLVAVQFGPQPAREVAVDAIACRREPRHRPRTRGAAAAAGCASSGPHRARASARRDCDVFIRERCCGQRRSWSVRP